MVRKVLDRGEIDLNSIKFKLGGDGHIQMFYASQFAQKQVIGDYTKDSDPNRSTWVFYSDQSDGIGVEDLRGQSKRSWWSTINTDYPGNGFLPGLATSITPPVGFIVVNADMELNANWTNNGGTSGRITTPTHGGSYSWEVKNAGASVAGEAYQDLSVTIANYQGAYVAISGYLYGDVVTGCQLRLEDGIGTTSSTLRTGAAWELTTVLRKFDAAATLMRLTLLAPAGGASNWQYFDDVFTPAATTKAPLTMFEFNSQKYVVYSNLLLKLNGTGDGYTIVFAAPKEITACLPSLNDCVYIFVGDTIPYFYMTTAEVVAQTNTAAYTYAIHWNGKLCAMTTAGQLASSTNPNAAASTWTNKGLLDTVTFGTIQNLRTYTDSSGNDQVYCATTKGLLMHDFTNSLWLNTELQVPKHTDNGKGLVVQNGKLYYSAGMSVYEYSLSGGSLVIRNIGLDTDDGLPDEYTGSIVGLVTGYQGDLFALVDGSLTSTSNFSSVMRYTGLGWVPVWTNGTANKTMSCGLASSVYAYRLWFGSSTDTIYWIALDRSRRNPLKTTSYFATTGMYISPWFDGEWAGNKLALATRALVRGSSSTETIALRYRIDKATTDVVASTAGWTLQDTLVAADSGVESVVGFASSAGLAYKTIQFRADFARASGTTTVTPNLIYAALEYEKNITPKWGWNFTLDCQETYANLTPVQQRDAIITIVESQTLVPFYYGGPSEPKYVRVKPAEGERLTGQGSIGQFKLVAVEK